MTPLKKGDPCRVRLHTGEVVEAVYEKCAGLKCHYAFVNNERVFVGKHKRWKPKEATMFAYEVVNFVGPSCDHVDIVPVGVSV